MSYNNYFSCLTCIKDNFIENKHDFVFRSVRMRTITALLALVSFLLYANSRQKSPAIEFNELPVNSTIGSPGFQLRYTESCENILEFKWAKSLKDKAANLQKKYITKWEGVLVQVCLSEQ